MSVLGRPGDPFAEWCLLRERDGARVTGIVLYRLAARERGLAPHELPLKERQALAARASPILFPGFEARGEKRPLEPVEIVPYDPAWPHLYEVWRARLDTAIGAAAERIEHVGSTSVPGLPAKPIVDIQVSVGELSKEVRYVPACESLGLQLRGSDDEHRYLQPSPDRPREVHVHVCPSGGRWERIHLLFRDFLRSDARARDSYAEMKHRQAETWKDDRWAYTESKTDLILQLMDRAEEWASRVGWTVAGSCSR